MKSLFFLALISALPSLPAAEVSIDVQGKKLVGDLNVAEKTDSPVVLILPGSGPTDRDGNTVGAPGKNNSLKYLADFLNAEKIPTLRIDKRGVGASASAAPKQQDLRFSTYVEDAEQWIKFLRDQGYTEIILVGHSEGALVATLAASSESVTGLVSLAGAGRPLAAILREQLKPRLPAALYEESDKIILNLSEGKTTAEISPALNSLFHPTVQPYLISSLRIDPAKAISEVKVPVLVIQGSTDIQVSTKDAELLHEAAKGSKLMIIEGMNHILKQVDGDLMKQLPSYTDPALPLHKDIGPGLLAFIRTTKKS